VLWLILRSFQSFKTFFKRTNPILIPWYESALLLQIAQDVQRVTKLFFGLLSPGFRGNV
jgi:hypothetical protein